MINRVNKGGREGDRVMAGDAREPNFTPGLQVGGLVYDGEIRHEERERGREEGGGGGGERGGRSGDAWRGYEEEIKGGRRGRR